MNRLAAEELDSYPEGLIKKKKKKKKKFGCQARKENGVCRSKWWGFVRRNAWCVPQGIKPVTLAVYNGYMKPLKGGSQSVALHKA